MSLTVTAEITRDTDHGGPSALDLEDPGNFRIVDAGRGGLTWIRESVDSPYVHGRTLVNAHKDVEIVPLSIRVYGSSASDLDTNIALLCRAFEQFTYELEISIDGVESRWTCEMADYASNSDGTWDKFSLMAFQQLYVFQVPRNPTPISGAH